MNPGRCCLLLFLAGVLVPALCRQTSAQAPDPAAAASTSSARDPLREAYRKLSEKWTGDLDGMVQRRYIRALVTYSRTNYFIDRGQQRGATYEGLKEFEKVLNQKYGDKTLQLNIVFIPVRRDQLLSYLAEGRGDLAAANLTVTEARRRLVDFSSPVYTGVSELVVTGPGAPPLAKLEDLAGKEVFVRGSSSYYESLQRLNARWKQAGQPPVNIRKADELLEDEDLLEMVNAGLIKITVVDSHIAEFWDQVFDQITVHQDLAVASGGQIAWALRKNCPQLEAEVSAFTKSHGKGTLFGNVVLKKYLKDVRYVRNSTSEAEMKRFRQAVDYFKKYAGQYGFDWLMVAAQAYQESRIDQSLRSPVGAVGVMQIKPETAADRNVNIPNVHELEDNIHAGIKYLRFMMDHYFKDAPMDRINKGLFAFASYNAGPARIARLRQQAGELGLDPNKWFYNVELVAAKSIGRETVQYVSNIFKYYLAYTIVLEQHTQKEGKKTRARQPA